MSAAILEKVRKLLALAEGGANEHECAAAAAAAARILARHNLTLDALDHDESEPEDEHEECRAWEDASRPGLFAKSSTLRGSDAATVAPG
jgi:hypothetical protein